MTNDDAHSGSDGRTNCLEKQRRIRLLIGPKPVYILNEGGQAVRPTDGTFVLAFLHIMRDSSNLGNNCVVFTYKVYSIRQDRKDIYFVFF